MLNMTSNNRALSLKVLLVHKMGKKKVSVFFHFYQKFYVYLLTYAKAIGKFRLGFYKGVMDPYDLLMQIKGISLRPVSADKRQVGKNP